MGHLQGRRRAGAPAAGCTWPQSAGYDLLLERLSFAGAIEWRRGAGRAAVEYGRGPVPRIPSDSYPPLFNSAQSLLGLDDYFDYYWREGLRWRIGLSLPRRIGLELGFKDEAHSSLEGGTDAFNLLGRDWSRPNPAVEEGRLRSLEAGFTWGGRYRPFGMTANRRVEARVEHGSPALGGDFSFTRLRLALDGHFKTFLKRRSVPNALDLRLAAGYSLGELPPQRFGALEAGMAFFSPFGTFRTVRGHPFEGERYAALYWEHNFKSTPFELLGLWHWAMRGTGLVVHGASGKDVDRPGAAGRARVRSPLPGRLPPRGGDFADTVQFAAHRPHPAAGPARLERRGERRPFRFRAGQDGAAVMPGAGLSGSAKSPAVFSLGCSRGRIDPELPAR